jgi:uncharacterized protein YdeI (YjbR/CyaY-like superfamily)
MFSAAAKLPLDSLVKRFAADEAFQEFLTSFTTEGLREVAKNEKQKLEEEKGKKEAEDVPRYLKKTVEKKPTAEQSYTTGYNRLVRNHILDFITEIL